MRRGLSTAQRFALLPALAIIAWSGLLASFAWSGESFVGFESGHVRPLALSPTGDFLFAVNTPDNRVEIFRPEQGSLVSLGEAVVGLEPVAVAALSDDEIFVVNHLSDSVSVVDVSDPAVAFVRRTLWVGDEPRDVVIAGSDRDRVFVTTAHRGQNSPLDPATSAPGVGRADVWIFDTNDLDRDPQILTLFCDTPRALAVSPDGERVFVAAMHSGNRTSVLNEVAVHPFFTFFPNDDFVSLGVPEPRTVIDGEFAPSTGMLIDFDGESWRDLTGRDWTPRTRLTLPDRDVFELDATRDPVVEVDSFSGVGTTLFAMAVHPTSGDVYVTNTEARNRVRFEPALRGHVVDNRVTILTGRSEPDPQRSRVVDLNPQIDRSSPRSAPDALEHSLSTPVAAVFDRAGDRLFVAAFGSEKVAVLDVDGEVRGRIDVGGGPSGMALDETRQHLYVMNRFDHTISIVDLSRLHEERVVSLRHNPEPTKVRAGRRFLYDAKRSSGHGDASCASCHVFADSDQLAWNLGDPDGEIVPATIDSVATQGFELPPYHPLKGPMMTQSLRGLEGAGPMHWRGDRNGGVDDPGSDERSFLEFASTFETLLGLEASLPSGDMRSFYDFVRTIRYPPNPLARLDGELDESQLAGRRIFLGDGRRDGDGGDGTPCSDCHAGAIGTAGEGVFAGDQTFKVPHLRGLYQKIGMFGTPLPKLVADDRVEPTPTRHLGPQVRGFGFTHDGSIPTLSDFLRQPIETFVFPEEIDYSAEQKVEDLASFLLVFPTGLAPAVGQQVTIRAKSRAREWDRLALLRRVATNGDGDLVGHGIVRARPWSALRETEGGDGIYRTSRAKNLWRESALDSLARAGEAWITWTLVPPGSGERIGIDRDEDRVLDGDEIDAGFDPADRESRPGGPLALVLHGDCNSDTRLDISDAAYTLGVLFLGSSEFDCDESCDTNTDGLINLSDAVFTLNFLFRAGSPPRGYPECVAAAGSCREACATEE